MCDQESNVYIFIYFNVYIYMYIYMCIYKIKYIYEKVLIHFPTGFYSGAAKCLPSKVRETFFSKKGFHGR